MEDFFPDAVMAGINKANRARQKSGKRMALHVNDEVYTIRELDDSGFAIDVEISLPHRGRAQIFDGPKELFRCLIIHSSIEGNLQRFEYKRLTPHHDQAPRDYAEENEISGLISK